MSDLSMRLGDGRAALIDCGPILAELGEWLPIPLAERPPDYTAALGQPLALPIQCVLLQLPGRTLLVDACHPEVVPLAFDVPAGSQPSMGLLVQLATRGVAPEHIHEVVITHPHDDHINGLTRLDLQSDAPTFPNARHYLSQADWDALQPELAQPDSLAARTLGVLQGLGLLELLDGPRDLGDGLALLPAPGETPGHQILRFQSGDATLFCLGDLFHFQLEAEHQQHVVDWGDADLKRHTRAALLPSLIAENAVLASGHISGFGRLKQSEGGALRWERLVLQ
jgi:glyoxylase-like metal-dependent hydrolase (beta-lactamase superfamily II)